MSDIPLDVTDISDEGDIPKTVAELDQSSEAPEARPYVISFQKYNEKLCEIDSLGKNKGNKALSILKKVGTKVSTRADFQKYGIQTKPIIRDGAYKPLFNRLADDIEIREMFLQDTGRIFYFDIEPDRVLYVVAITENHLETDKVRR